MASVNMRVISLLVLAGLAALACGISVPSKNAKVADKDFLYRQKSILELLQHVHQNEVLPKLYKEAESYKFLDHLDKYENVEVVRHFVELYRVGLLPLGEIFTVFNDYHREQAVTLFKVFYYAKDFETFLSAMKWARFHVNEGMFIYALTVAVLHRADTVGIVLPAPYEIYPYYFFSSESIQWAQHYKMEGFYGVNKVDNMYSVVIPTNYSDYRVMNSFEQKLSYFTEDIGLNSYYSYFQADYPFWMGGKDFTLSKDRRGELYLFNHQQILARYYLERLSNDLGEIPEFSFYEPIKTGYKSGLRYYNGVFFPTRGNNFDLYYEQNYYDVDVMIDYENRIRDAITYGFITLADNSHIDLTKPESIEYLGNWIQGNPDSFNTRFLGYFTLFSKVLMGYENNQYKVLPSVLEQFETSLRDPMFYMLYKRIIEFYWEFKDLLPQYKREEIEFKGVKIESVEMDKLVTYFDRFEADITNAVDVEVYDIEFKSELLKFGRVSQYEGEEIYIKARQMRLNHLPFSYKLKVVSDKAAPAIVRAYLGPKYDEFGRVIEINENRENFVLMDVFKYDLVAGENMITRDSQEFLFFVKDRTTYFELYKQVMLAFNGQTKFTLDMTEAHNGFPSRLMLPKGKKAGMPFQFFFVVTPQVVPTVVPYSTFDYTMSAGVGSGARYMDYRALGYPLDRKIDVTQWYTPNMYYYDTNIFFKKEAEINAVHF